MPAGERFNLCCSCTALLRPCFLLCARPFVPLLTPHPHALFTGTAAPAVVPGVLATGRACTAGPRPKAAAPPQQQQAGPVGENVLSASEQAAAAAGPVRRLNRPRSPDVMGLTQSSAAHKGGGKRAAICKELDRCVSWRVG